MRLRSMLKPTPKKKRTNLSAILNSEYFFHRSIQIQMALNQDRLLPMDYLIKKAKPKINNAFLELEERLIHNKKKTRENKERALTLENTKYTNRVMGQKARVLNARYLKKLFEENHDKYLELLSRPMRLNNKNNKNNKKMSRTINFKTRLPKISSTVTEGFYSKARFKTDSSNLLSSTNEQSKDNSLELTEQRRNEMVHNKPGNLHSSNH